MAPANKNKPPMGKHQMLRLAVLGMISLAAGSALAQQSPPKPDAATPAPSSTPAAPSKAVVTMEEPLPGDRWTYEVRDEITGTITATRTNVVTEVTPNEISIRFKIAGTPNEGLNIYDRSWNLMASSPWKYSPHDGTGIMAPLTVGKTWNLQSNDINSANGLVGRRSGTSKVVGQESLTTRAGTFETFKIETSYSIRGVNDPTKRTDITSQTWYAPAIDHWVKRIFTSRVDKHLKVNNTLELVEYGRKQ
jgi:hypothetical protein